MEPSLTSLPYELIFNILKNLPPKILLRCRCVCKDWNSIISGESFVNAHLLFLPDGYLFSHYIERWDPSSSTPYPTQLCSFFRDDSFSPPEKFQVPLPFSSDVGPCRILVGSVNGLVCLTDWRPFGRKLYLWNPTIRKHITLPETCFKGKHRQRYLHRRTRIVFGLGFRPATNDYIVIRIAVFKWRSRRLKSYPPPQAEAYSLNTNSWKKVGFPDDISRRLMGFAWPYAYLNGELNWVAVFSDEEDHPYRSILSFDVNKEEFTEIKLPIDCRNKLDSTSASIAVHRGFLAVIVYENETPDDGDEFIWFWVMEEHGNEDSWLRRRIETKGFGTFTFKGCALDKIIMFKKGDGLGNRAEVLDMATLEERRVCVSEFQSVHAFKQSLVSLEAPRS